MPDDDTLELGESPEAAASSPAAPETPPASSSPATTEPAGDIPVDDTTPASTPSATPPATSIPLDAHERVLATTRERFEDRLDRLSWAERLNREDVEAALNLHRLYNSDPRRLYDHLSQAFSTETAPEPDLQTPDGLPLYSAERMQQVVAHAVKQASAEVRREFETRLGPLEESSRATSRLRDIEAQLDTAQTWPGFTEHAKAITDLIADGNRRGQPIGLQDAYIAVVVPKLSASKDSLTAEAKKAVLAEIQKTTDDATDTIDPTRSPSPSRKKDSDKSWAELFEEEMATAARQPATVSS